MDIYCRKAQKEDVAALDRVMQVISDKPADLEVAWTVIEKINADEKKYLLIAEDRQTKDICGSLLGVVFEDICGDCRPVLLVENVAVLEKYQGHGVGKKMLEEVEAFGRSHNCRYVILVSGLTREGAHRFYARMGYNESKGFKKYL